MRSSWAKRRPRLGIHSETAVVRVTLYRRQWSGIVPFKKELFHHGLRLCKCPTFSEVTHKITEMVRLFECSFAHFDDIHQVLPNLDKQFASYVALASKKSV